VKKNVSKMSLNGVAAKLMPQIFPVVFGRKRKGFWGYIPEYLPETRKMARKKG
jgi:hypothetical protein